MGGRGLLLPPVSSPWRGGRWEEEVSYSLQSPLRGEEEGGRKRSLTPSSLLSVERRKVGGRGLLLPPVSSPWRGGRWEEEVSYSLQSPLRGEEEGGRKRSLTPSSLLSVERRKVGGRGLLLPPVSSPWRGGRWEEEVSYSLQSPLRGEEEGGRKRSLTPSSLLSVERRKVGGRGLLLPPVSSPWRGGRWEEEVSYSLQSPLRGEEEGGRKRSLTPSSLLSVERRKVGGRGLLLPPVSSPWRGGRWEEEVSYSLQSPLRGEEEGGRKRSLTPSSLLSVERRKVGGRGLLLPPVSSPWRGGRWEEEVSYSLQSPLRGEEEGGRKRSLTPSSLLSVERRKVGGRGLLLPPVSSPWRGGRWEEEVSYSLQSPLRGEEEGGRKRSLTPSSLLSVERRKVGGRGLLLPPVSSPWRGGRWEEEVSYSLQSPLRGEEEGGRKRSLTYYYCLNIRKIHNETGFGHTDFGCVAFLYFVLS